MSSTYSSSAAPTIAYNPSTFKYYCSIEAAADATAVTDHSQAEAASFSCMATAPDGTKIDAACAASEAMSKEYCESSDSFALACVATFNTNSGSYAIGAASSCATDNSVDGYTYACTTVAVTTSLSAAGVSYKSSSY